MYSFRDDYSEGAHSSILEALIKSNMEQELGYGNDSHSINAKVLIKKHLKNGDCNIHLIAGGTQTNLIAISSFLRPHQACIAVESGHIATHETGAIEATGHKVITVPTSNGKITTSQIQGVVDDHTDEHMVKPKLVYISNPTEVGTTYSGEEMKEIYEFCQKNNLLLYVDGARLGSAIIGENGNLSLEDFAKYTDSFFIGGTKNGALIGEALVINKKSLNEDFRFYIKQKGALTAKGRILGIQFEELFRDNLYYDLAKHGCDMAQKLQNAIIEKGYPLLAKSNTNQIFPIFSDEKIKELRQNFDFHIWEKNDANNSVIRLVCSWATDEGQVDKFIDSI
ncbi:MAG: aminotransferase class I/II-fold pyridoxal phosphate-dependent enzyme [Firmicutes bacterium]|jgi:threonine aldolase|nr:aminotransferase class I/II-fold pyridoxal phosphate-dependent enzyme [Bacillota bacterium]